MKRIDFVNGVILLALVLLTPVVLYVCGSLDERSYLEIIHEYSFYGETTEPVRTYGTFRLCLYIIYSFLCVIITGLAFEPTFRRVSRLQIQCYRPYYIYHSMVCLIPFVVRYINMNAGISDDIMLQIPWKNIFLIIFSVLRFIFSFLLSIVQRYKHWRILLFICVTVVHACLFLHLLYVLLLNIVEHLSVIKESKGEFLTAWSSTDHEQFPIEMNLSETNTLYRTFALDQSLFLRTGKKTYQTNSIQKLQLVNGNGKMPPYRREVFFRSIGESVNLYCAASIRTSLSMNILWSMRERGLTSTGNQTKIKTTFEKMHNGWVGMTSTLNINLINSSDFGDYSCSNQHYTYSNEMLFYLHKKAYVSIQATEILLGQYRIQNYTGKDYFIYATPGGAVDLTWKTMNFNSESGELLQYYYINGLHYSQQYKRNCSALSYLYVVYGQTMEWFVFPSFRSRMPSAFFVNYLDLYRTHFVECAGPSVFGIHSVEYFRQIYDEKSQSFILVEVKHPDTLIVLPDLPYFLKMDNTTKAKKELMIQKLHRLDLEYTWFENSHTYVLVVRVFFEMILLIFICLISLFLAANFWKFYTRTVLKPIRNMCLESTIMYISHPCDALECNIAYSCYIICGDNDKEFVYSSLVVPLRKENLKTGFFFEECPLNRSGKSEFDIQKDIIKQCGNMIFFITSAYLEEEAFVGIQLDTVLKCIRMEIIPANCVLIIIADNSDVPDKIRLNLPEAVIHDWVTITDPPKRLRQVFEWIKTRKTTRKSENEIAVSTVYFG